MRSLWLILLVTEIQLVTTEDYLGVATLVGLALLAVKAVRDRLGNEEDDHYSRTVEK